MSDVILWLTFIANPLGAVALIYLVFNNHALRRLPYILRFLCVAAAIGLVADFVQSAYWIFTGHASVIDDIILWAFKDFALVAFAFYFATKTVKRRQ